MTLIPPWRLEKKYVSSQKEVTSGWILRDSRGDYVCTVGGEQHAHDLIKAINGRNTLKQALSDCLAKLDQKTMDESYGAGWWSLVTHLLKEDL